VRQRLEKHNRQQLTVAMMMMMLMICDALSVGEGRERFKEEQTDAA